LKNPFGVIHDLEEAIAEYTGAPYAVVVNSCTMALLLSLLWHKQRQYRWYIEIPKHTYVSVPMSIKHAGFGVKFRDEAWRGYYQLKPYPIFDSARYFSADMYEKFNGGMACVSFHATKILADTQGGAVLLSDPLAVEWLKRMRFDGRTEGVAPAEDTFTEIGYHCYMSPDVAARLLHKISFLPKINAPLPNDAYPDLSTLEIFK